MSDAGTDPDLARTVADLARALEDLQRELEPGDRRRLRPPAPGELLRFTSDVAIPAAILVLETNVRALELLQRTLRMVDGRQPGGTDGASAEVRDRAERVTARTLSRLDGALQDLGGSLDEQPQGEAADLLAEVRELRAELDDQLAVDAPAETAGDPASTVDIDVESELQSIKDDVDAGDGPPDEPGRTDGTDEGDDGRDDGST